jgi:hypothetical protein
MIIQIVKSNQWFNLLIKKLFDLDYYDDIFPLERKDKTKSRHMFMVEIIN